MNPLTNVKNLQKLNQRELELGLTTKKSWHDKYKDSAWIFIGGLPYDLTEGDVLCVFSQYGEIVNINLVRDQKTGKSKGFCFICYEDQRSTILTVDNLNGIKLLGRVLRVDHVEDYKKPKDHGDEDEVTKKLRVDGCAPQIPNSPEEPSSEEDPMPVKVKKEKKVKKDKKKKKKKKAQSSSSGTDSDSDNEYKRQRGRDDGVKIKKEKYDPGYDRALNASSSVSVKRSYSPAVREDDGYSKYQRYEKHDRLGRNYEDRNRGYDRESEGGDSYRRGRDEDRRDYRDHRREERGVGYRDRDSERSYDDGRSKFSDGDYGDRRGSRQEKGYNDRDRGQNREGRGERGREYDRREDRDRQRYQGGRR